MRTTLLRSRGADILRWAALAFLVLGMVCHRTQRDTTDWSDVVRRLTETDLAKFRKALPNLVFIKAHKVGGSTMGGIVRRIVSRHGGTPKEYNHRLKSKDFFAKKWNVPNLDEDPNVKVHMWANHDRLSGLYIDSDEKVLKEAFKFALTRDPVDRCLSQFYYDYTSGWRRMWPDFVDEKGEYHPDPSGHDRLTQAKIEYAHRCMSDSVFPYLQYKEDQTMLEVLDFFQLVGLTERWVETVAILKMKLGLNYGDILHLSVKTNNGEFDASGKLTANGVARPPVSEEPQIVVDVINEFQETVLDKEFWKMASDRMDEQITKLTPDGFPEVRAKIERLLAELKEFCADEANYPSLTSEERRIWIQDHNDTRPDCYWGDNGCEILCMDTFAVQRGLNSY
ncbi:unnamed protein product [Discosporangium mesarthrocarpum]